MKHHTVLRCISPAVVSSCNIAVLWGFGLVCGRICWQNAAWNQYSGVAANALDPGSMFCLFLWQLLPFLIAFVTAGRRAYFLLYIAVFIRSFCTGFSASIIAGMYHSAGWLVYRTLFFGDSAVSVLFLWLSLKLSSSRTRPISLLVHCVWIAVLTICMIDLFLVSNFVTLF